MSTVTKEIAMHGLQAKKGGKYEAEDAPAVEPRCMEIAILIFPEHLPDQNKKSAMRQAQIEKDIIQMGHCKLWRSY